ncbi:Shedu immune nuclease family protein [Myxococcus xanthus]|uniref:Shedu immune nuclease family protein n=1 Tax=Myxococcus xanthus TaxID=34 RepID=UPI001375900F|nr:Shedu immune nuclease family protein [Myxococcus xanthus]
MPPKLKSVSPTEEFETLIGGGYTEPKLQEFLEKNPLFIPQIRLLNHGLHLECMISQFPLGTELKTDFVYITKSSVRWEVVLIEIERPDKKLFTKNRDQVTPTAELTSAQAQIDTWDDFIKKNRNEVIRKLKPLLIPIGMEENEITFRFILIIGRSDQLKGDQARKDRWASYSNNARELMTFDSMLRYYVRQEKHLPKLKKPNILSLKKRRFSLKYMHHLPFGLFSHLGPDRLKIKDRQRERLINAGYEISAWENGELLSINGKWTKYPPSSP